MDSNHLSKYISDLYNFFNKMVSDGQTSLELKDFFTDDFCMYSNTVKVAANLNEFSENLVKVKKAYKQIKFDLPFKEVLIDHDKVCVLFDTQTSGFESGDNYITHVMAIYYLDPKQERFNKKIEITSREKI